MWPRILLPGTDASVASYHLLNLAGWLVLFVAGAALTWRRPGFVRHWWWMFLGMVLSWIGAGMIARLIDVGTLRRVPYRYPGAGYFGGPLLFLAWTGAYVLIHRVRAYPFLDAFAIAFSLSRAVSKVACFAAGCCSGRPTDGVLGVVFPNDPTRRHPTQLYEATFHLLTASVLGLLYARGRLKGRLVMILGASYGAGRLLVEPLRASHPVPFLGGPMTVKQVASLLILVFCTTYLLLGRAGVRPAGSRRDPEGGSPAGDAATG